MLVSWNKRKLAERYVQLIAKLLFHLFQDRMKSAARRTFKITKLFQVCRCARLPVRMRRVGAGNAGIERTQLLNRSCLRTRRLLRRRLLSDYCWSRGYRAR